MFRIEIVYKFQNNGGRIMKLFVKVDTKGEFKKPDRQDK